MEELLTVSAQGHAHWGSARYAIKLAERATTRHDSTGSRSQCVRAWEVLFDDPSLGFRRFWSEAERSAFISSKLSHVEVEELRSPDRRSVPHVLAEVVGRRLGIVDFVWDYVQLRFDLDTPDPPPLNLYVRPRFAPQDDRGHADRLVALIGSTVVGVDEVLDLGLVLDFDDKTRVTVPLDGTDLNAGAEVASYTSLSTGGTMVWRPGDEPIAWLPVG